MANACLVLLPKHDFPNPLTEFRSINLSNFINKIISKVICTRLAPILPKIISPNKSRFVKGRSITKNIMLVERLFKASRNLINDVMWLSSWTRKKHMTESLEIYLHYA